MRSNFDVKKERRMDPRKILIAGATGQLGRALVSVGLNRGYRIRAVARRPEALEEAFREAAKKG